MNLVGGNIHNAPNNIYIYIKCGTVRTKNAY